MLCREGRHGAAHRREALGAASRGTLIIIVLAREPCQTAHMVERRGSMVLQTTGYSVGGRQKVGRLCGAMRES